MGKKEKKGKIRSRSEKLISVVIPTYYRPGSVYGDRPRKLLALLHSLQSQSIPKSQFEVIIVSDKKDNGSEPVIMDILRRNSNMRFFQIEASLAGPKRNYGVSVAKSERILFLDDDMTASENLLENHLKTAEKGKR